ncbi:fhaB [Symbiodinium natans]|uniref:FhaB protein n=1 Tax=Symbiodinium natans TaxID=878477 RepID=A0A812KK23_9DINO|nr:fhaB [Symbiodinium natans]
MHSPSHSPTRRPRFSDGSPDFEDRGRRNSGSVDRIDRYRESSRARESSRPPDDSRARKLSLGPAPPRRALSSSGSFDLSSPKGMEGGIGFSSMSSQWAATAQLFESSLQNSLCLTPSSCSSTTRTAPFRTPTPPPQRARAKANDGNSSDYSDDFEAPPRPALPAAPTAPAAPAAPVAPAARAPAALAPSAPAAPTAPVAPIAPVAPQIPAQLPPPARPVLAPAPASPAPPTPQLPAPPTPSVPVAPLAPATIRPPPVAPATPATPGPAAPGAPVAPIAPAAPFPPAAPMPPPPSPYLQDTFAGEATRDDASLLRILEEVSPPDPPPPPRSLSASRSPRPARKSPRSPRSPSSPKSPSRKGFSDAYSTEAAGKVHVVVQHLTELCEPISTALCLSDLILEKDVKVAGVLLRKGMRLVPWKGLESCHSYTSLLHSLEKSLQLTFEWPQVTPPVPDLLFVPYEWRCPQCLEPLPMQVPEACSAVALLRSAVPGVDDFIDGPPRNLWQISEMDSVPKQKLQEHVLKDTSDWASTTELRCSACHQSIWNLWNPPAYRCDRCGLAVCPQCLYNSKRLHQPLCCPPTRSSAGDTCRLLAAHLHKPFDLSPLLDVGSLARCPDSAAGRLLQRKAGRLIPLREAAEYYGRAALLHAKAEKLRGQGLLGASQPMERQHLLHEAREALGTALHGLRGPRGASKKPKTDPEQRAVSAPDPRVWYLLGLVMCSLGSPEEGRHAYRQALCHLPMGIFAHAVHFNSALIHSRSATAGNSAAEAAAKRALHEFRRCCRGMLGRRDEMDGGRSCKLCGTCFCTEL